MYHEYFRASTMDFFGNQGRRSYQDVIAARKLQEFTVLKATLELWMLKKRKVSSKTLQEWRNSIRLGHSQHRGEKEFNSCKTFIYISSIFLYVQLCVFVFSSHSLKKIRLLGGAILYSYSELHFTAKSRVITIIKEAAQNTNDPTTNVNHQNRYQYQERCAG